MAVSTSGNQIYKEQVVNDVLVYKEDTYGYAQYLKEKELYHTAYKGYQKQLAAFESLPSFLQKEENKPEEPKLPDMKDYFLLPLEGLRILDVSVSEKTKMTSSPIETGVEITDFKIRMPVEIKIKGICDNLREAKDLKIETTSDKFAKVTDYIPVVGGMINSIASGVYDAVMGYEYTQSLQVLTRARAVYANIHNMLMNKSFNDNFGEVWKTSNLPEGYTIATKGAIYQNMMLESAEQLNDAEHLMVIPVTLNFKEVILASTAGSDNIVSGNDQDGPLTMSGNIKSTGIVGAFKEGGFMAGTIETINTIL